MSLCDKKFKFLGHVISLENFDRQQIKLKLSKDFSNLNANL